MKIVIFGLGSIGKRHAKVLQKMGGHDLYAFRSQIKNSGNDLNLTEVYSWDEVKKLNANIALISNPTNEHIKTAIQAAKLGLHLFIEKPIDCTDHQLNELLNIVETKQLTSYVAYVLRFHPAVKYLKEKLSDQKLYHIRLKCSSYLPDWRGQNKPDTSYSSFINQGGGVLLDLSHEFDLIQYLFGDWDSVQSVSGKSSDVTVDSWDFFDGILKTKSDVPINIHLNFLSQNLQREIQVDTESGFYQIDLINNTYLYKNSAQNPVLEKFDLVRDDLFLEQMQYFLNHLGNSRLDNDLFQASPLFHKILQLNR